MKKVAIINSVLDYGSTGSLARSLYEYGKCKGYNAFVFYGRGPKMDNCHLVRIDSKLEVYFHKFMTLLTGYQGSFSNRATSKLLNFLTAEKITKVILLNIHGYYLNEKRLLAYLKNNNIVTAYVTPDEYAGLGKCCYSLECQKYRTECKDCPHIGGYPKSVFFDRANDIFNMKKEAYTGFTTLTILGPESNLAKFREGVLLKGKPLKRLSWGIDLSLYKYEIDESLYEKYRIPKNKILILTVAPYSNVRKGVKEYFFEAAKRLQNTDYHFINIGYDGKLKKEEMPKNMTTIGYLDDQKELAHLYSMADLYVLASTTDTMPVSCLISFGCETPVCCFYTSGLRYLAPRDNPAISYCEDVSLDSIVDVINRTGKKDKIAMASCRKLAKEEYSVDAFCRKVYEVFEVD